MPKYTKVEGLLLIVCSNSIVICRYCLRYVVPGAAGRTWLRPSPADAWSSIRLGGLHSCVTAVTVFSHETLSIIREMWSSAAKFSCCSGPARPWFVWTVGLLAGVRSWFQVIVILVIWWCSKIKNDRIQMISVKYALDSAHHLALLQRN